MNYSDMYGANLGSDAGPIAGRTGAEPMAPLTATAVAELAPYFNPEQRNTLRQRAQLNPAHTLREVLTCNPGRWPADLCSLVDAAATFEANLDRTRDRETRRAERKLAGTQYSEAEVRALSEGPQYRTYTAAGITVH